MMMTMQLLEAYKNNVDMHYLTSSLVLEKEIPHTKEEKEDAEKNPNSKFICKEERSFGKSCNFGLNYGISKAGFASMIVKENPKMTIPQVEKYYDKYFDTYKGIKAKLDEAKNTFMYGTNMVIPRWVKFKTGAMKKIDREVPYFTVCQTLFGRKLAVDDPRKMVNYPVQGSGADTIKLAITKLGYDMRNINSTHRTINLVHDDTVGECYVPEFDTNSKIFRDALGWAVNYILRRQFFTPVDQDFCVLSMFGEEVFIEGALTLNDIKDKLLDGMKHNYEKLQEAQKANDTKESTTLIQKLNTQNRVYQRLNNYLTTGVL